MNTPLIWSYNQKPRPLSSGLFTTFWLFIRGGRLRQRCRVSYVTRASNWYWLTVGQGLLSLTQVWVEGECFYFFCFFAFIPVNLSSLSLSFISSTIFISFLPFSGRRHKMTHKGWHVVKPQHNQSINWLFTTFWLSPLFGFHHFLAFITFWLITTYCVPHLLCWS